MKSDITIILLLYKTPLRLIKNFEVFKDFNVIVLDQSNDSEFKKKLLKILPNINSYTLSKKNSGFAKGVNFLVKKVNTRFFFCTQADVNIDKNSILKLKKTILRDQKKTIIAVPLINKKNIKKGIKEIEVKSMIGASFLCDKKKFIEIGMFDEDFFFYWEDVELSNRIQNFNYKIYQNNRSRAFHQNSNSSMGGFKTDFIRYKNFIFGELLYDYKKNKTRFVKILRKFIKGFLLLFFNLIFFRLKNVNKSFAEIMGIFKFIKFFIKK